MQVYSEREIGPIKIVSRDSCHAEIYICGRTPAEATQAEQPLDCLT